MSNRTASATHSASVAEIVTRLAARADLVGHVVAGELHGRHEAWPTRGRKPAEPLANRSSPRPARAASCSRTRPARRADPASAPVAPPHVAPQRLGQDGGIGLVDGGLVGGRPAVEGFPHRPAPACRRPGSLTPISRRFTSHVAEHRVEHGLRQRGGRAQAACGDGGSAASCGGRPSRNVRQACRERPARNRNQGSRARRHGGSVQLESGPIGAAAGQQVQHAHRSKTILDLRPRAACSRTPALDRRRPHE